MKYLLIGFPKCGQNSILKHYRDEGLDMHSYEMCWRTNARQHYDSHFAGMKPVFVKRNVFDFLLSGYNYWGYAEQGMPFKDFLYMKGYDEAKFGEQNPIIRSDFNRWIRPFDDLSPIIHDISNFKERENITNKIKTDLSKEDILDICTAVRKYAMRIDEFG